MNSICRIAAAGLLVLAAAPGLAADVAGLWCGTGLLHEFSLDLAQPSPEEVSGTLTRKQRKRELYGRVEGNVLRTQSTKVGALVLELDGGELRIVGGEGPIALAHGMVFTRARGDSCDSARAAARP